eukprot:TRINITY_DN1788_c0_g2_i1.p1 TRINITY_DN1788_c0_g2~~TRINITY_DN1788_c0_g2_i1.p1  ORF type:complete len:105 (+),score=1.75 TRINITY_DN1788_c0_g2_i1:154-468(+)
MVALFDSWPMTAAAATTVIGGRHLRLSIPCHLELNDLLIRFSYHPHPCRVVCSSCFSRICFHRNFFFCGVMNCRWKSKSKAGGGAAHRVGLYEWASEHRHIVML